MIASTSLGGTAASSIVGSAEGDGDGSVTAASL
jgi:hypothetical protein